MILNTQRTQPEMVEFNLTRLEEGTINTDSKETLLRILPQYVKRIDGQHVLFMNYFDEVVLDIPTLKSSINLFNDGDYFKKLNNFRYLFLPHQMVSQHYICYESKDFILNLQNHKKYIKEVRSLIQLLQS